MSSHYEELSQNYWNQLCEAWQQIGGLKQRVENQHLTIKMQEEKIRDLIEEKYSSMK